MFPDGEGGNVCRSDGGETHGGNPKSVAVWWKSETRWSTFPVVRRGERGAGVPILEEPPWWGAMSGGEGGDARPNNEDEKCGRGDRAQNDVVLRNVGGGKEGSRSVVNHCDLFLFFSFFLFFFLISIINCFYRGKHTHVLIPRS